MQYLKKEQAPLTEAAWEEIEDQARKTLNAWLTARRFLTVEPPHGWDYPGFPMGRLTEIQEEKDGLCYAPRVFRPVVEIRKSFILDRWEMDNISRGCEDPDLAPLEKAAESVGRFEDQAIYKGLSPVGHPGLIESAGTTVKITKNPDWADLVTSGITTMRKSAIAGPYALILCEPMWNQLATEIKGYPLKKYLENLLEGPVIMSPNLEGGLLVQHHSEDLRLITGQDISIGYQSHDEKKVELFFTETFALKIVEPAAILRYSH